MSYGGDDSVDIVEGALFGAGAYVVGLVVMLIATILRGTPAAANVPAGETTTGIATIVDYGGFSGYLFAHLWVHELSLLTEIEFALHLLPFTFFIILLLVAAGAVVTSINTGYRSTGGFKHGASIIIGYFPLAVLATVAVGVGINDIQLLSLDSILTLFVAGIVYPAVFGGIGSLLADGL